MRKISESLEELGDNWRLEINPDIPPGPKFPSDLILCKKKSVTYTRQAPRLTSEVISWECVDQAGSERTEAGESALPAEESPQPGRAERKLWEILQEDIIDFILGH